MRKLTILEKWWRSLGSKGPGRGWWGPPKGTHTPSVEGAPSTGGITPTIREKLGRAPTFDDFKWVVEKELGREANMGDMKIWHEARKEFKDLPPLTRPQEKREPLKGPRVLAVGEIDVQAITPHPKYSAERVAEMRSGIEKSRQEAIQAYARMDTLKSVGAVKRWGKRAKSAEQSMRYGISVLEGRT